MGLTENLVIGTAAIIGVYVTYDKYFSRNAVKKRRLRRKNRDQYVISEGKLSNILGDSTQALTQEMQQLAQKTKDFENQAENQCFIAGTIMSIKEKKTSKGNSFAIVKFSDLSKVFELFLFSEILEENRKKLIEGQSFLLTVMKDKENQENRFRRISVRKIVSLKETTKINYKDVLIEMNKSEDLEKLYEKIKEKGNSKIKISINDNNENYLFELKDKRKFDFETLKNLNNEQYIKKITV